MSIQANRDVCNATTRLCAGACVQTPFELQYILVPDVKCCCCAAGFAEEALTALEAQTQENSRLRQQLAAAHVHTS